MRSISAGLRQGELLALRWRDVDFEDGTLAVSRQVQRKRRDGSGSDEPGLLFSQPKSKKGRRTIRLSTLASGALTNHQKHQLEEKQKAGTLYRDEGLVFATKIGTPLDAQNMVNRHFKPLLKRAGLPNIRFHDLRHTCATLWPKRTSITRLSRTPQATPGSA